MKRSLISLLFGTLALAGCTTYTGTPATSPGGAGGVPGASGWPATPFDCATLGAQPDTPEDALPGGAARITLCNEPGHEFSLVVPPDALVTGTEAVITAFNAQEKPNLAATSCTADFGPAYRLVVEYPDAVVQLRGELYGCAFVGERFGARDVLDAFAEGLRAQRETLPVTVADPLAGAACGGAASWLPTTMDATIAGYRCSGDDQEPLLIDEAGWATIRDDWTAHAVRASSGEGWPADCDQSGMDLLVGVSATGETVTLSGLCGVYQLQLSGDDQVWTWRPGPEASEVLDAVVG